MMHKAWSNKEEVPYCFSRSSVKFKVTGDSKSPILTRIERFRTVTLAWIHRWLWNDGQRLKQDKRGATLFFKVIRQISRSHRTINRRFWPELSISGHYLQFEFTKVLKMMHKAWCNLEEVPYNFSRSSIKFQGHTGCKIDDFNPFE